MNDHTMTLTRRMGLAPLLAALVLAGCATAPTPPKAEIDVPASFKASGGWPSTTPP
jgi:hypothetical protein